MKALDIDVLPVLVISSDPIDLKRPRKENTVVIKSEALKVMARHGKLLQFISNIPVWARLGVLKDKAKWEGEVKGLLAEVWEHVKSLILINIP